MKSQSLILLYLCVLVAVTSWCSNEIVSVAHGDAQIGIKIKFLNCLLILALFFNTISG